MAKNKGFNVRDMMSDASKKGTDQSFELRDIPIENIIPSENNHYSIERIEELAASIETQGLMHNLVVLEANEEGKHELISGERRLHACRMLYDAGNMAFATIPCKVDQETDRDAAELKLIFGNSTARILSDAEKARQVARSKELLKNLRDKGYPIKGRLRSALATLYGVSDAQIGRMESIEANLIPQIKDEFVSGDLGVTGAYEISTIEPERQPEALEAYKQGGVKAVQEKKRAKTYGKETQDDIDYVLINAICNERLMERFWQAESIKDRSELLKHDCGTGGGTITFPVDRRGFQDHDAKGIRVYCNGLDHPSISVTWTEAAKRIGELIENMQPQEATPMPKAKLLGLSVSIDKNPSEDSVTEARKNLVELSKVADAAVEANIHRRNIISELNRIIQDIEINGDCSDYSPEELKQILKESVELLSVD